MVDSYMFRFVPIPNAVTVLLTLVEVIRLRLIICNLSHTDVYICH